MLEFAVESWSKTIRTRAGVRVHLEEGIFYFLLGKGDVERAKLGDKIRVEEIEIDEPVSRNG